MVLAIRSRNYLAGAGVIDGLHREEESFLSNTFGWNTKYTFTVASVEKEFVNTDKASEMSGNVDTAYIYLIEKSPGSVENIYREIEKQFPDVQKSKQSVLGYNDEVIELHNIPWKNFLQLYREKIGILNPANKIYYNNLNGVTTIIGLEQKKTTNNLDTVLSEPSEICLCKIMQDKCEAMLEAMSERESVKNLKRSFYQIINSLQKFEQTPFSDYLFLPTAFPLNMALDMAEEMNAGMPEYADKEELFTYFYEFVKGLNLYVQNSNRTDRQFIQTPKFNIQIYDIPTKMNAFYNAYIFNLLES